MLILIIALPTDMYIFYYYRIHAKRALASQACTVDFEACMQHVQCPFNIAR